MKRQLLFGAIAILAASVMAQDSGSKDAVVAAAKKLAAQPNYSWKTTREGGRFSFGPTLGQTEKGGYTHISRSFRNNTMEFVNKGKKGAIKTQEGWQSASASEDNGGGQRGRGRFFARMVANFKAPAEQAEEIASKLEGVEESDGVYSADLGEAGVKALMPFGRGRQGGPDISNAKGSVKFWIKDGMLSKFQYHVKATFSFNGNNRDIDNTTTVEIKEVGTTKVEVPDEAKKTSS